MAPKFERVSANELNFEELDNFPDRSVQQTLPWVDYVAEIHNAEPVFLVLHEGGSIIGYFTGLMVGKCGIRILGSPFAGWNTRYMGFNLSPGVSRGTALQALWDCAFGPLGCGHVEVMDRHMFFEDCNELQCQSTMYNTHVLNLTHEEDDLLKIMKRQCRQNIRKAEKCGVCIEEAHDSGFADDYCSQRAEVFRKNGVFSAWGIERVKLLISSLLPTGNLLLLRARNREGVCIATLITMGMNDFALGWGLASRIDLRDVRPNEALFWYAIKYWRDRGVKYLDFLGQSSWKEKFGAEPVAVPWVRKSKNPLIGVLRDSAETVYSRTCEFVGKMNRSRFLSSVTSRCLNSGVRASEILRGK